MQLYNFIYPFKLLHSNHNFLPWLKDRRFFTVMKGFIQPLNGCSLNFSTVKLYFWGNLTYTKLLALSKLLFQSSNSTYKFSVCYLICVTNAVNQNSNLNLRYCSFLVPWPISLYQPGWGQRLCCAQHCLNWEFAICTAYMRNFLLLSFTSQVDVSHNNFYFSPYKFFFLNRNMFSSFMWFIALWRTLTGSLCFMPLEMHCWCTGIANGRIAAMQV